MRGGSGSEPEPSSSRTAFRTCPLCEAGCGLEITVKRSADGLEHVSRVRGDMDDVFSEGFICPKGSTLRQLHDDPDRVRRPLVKRNGVHVEVEWSDAWAEVERGLVGVIERHGRQAVGVYIGNPNAHNLAGMAFGRSVMQPIGTRNIFSASTVDQMPRQVAAASTPNSEQLDAALSELEFMVSVDIYLNETTRHADVILPSPSALQKSHYDLLLLQFAVRNVANFSPPVLALDDDQPDEWEILAKLALIAQGAGADADAAIVDDMMIRSLIASLVRDEHSSVFGRDVEDLLVELSKDGRRGPDRMIGLAMQTGPCGAAFGAGPVGGASLDLLLEHPHGVDFGALEPRLPEVVHTPSGMVELDHPVLMSDLARLSAAIADLTERELVLIGRRHLRSNNSWMHNVAVLVKGTPRCTLQVHPDDAARFGLVDGGRARITSRVGTVDAPVEVTDAVRPGVVSLPHGWGHGQADTKMRVAAERAGTNSNVLTDHETMDPLSGTSVLNGIPVVVAAA